ncbi:1,4-alpha-glucan branching protein GlgB [Calditrichota bacterium]
MELGSESRHALILSSPERLEQPEIKKWGVFVPVYSLRGKDDWGVGTYTDLADLCEWIGEQGGGVVGTLPLLPQFIPDEAGSGLDSISPYNAVSRLFLTESFIDVTVLPEFTNCSEAAELTATSTFQDELNRLRQLQYVDFDGVWTLKKRILKLLHKYLESHPSARQSEFVKYRDSNQQLTEYAKHRADISGGDDIDFQIYQQWIASEQLESARQKALDAGVTLYLDLPLGSHSDGFDKNTYTSEYVQRLSVGAPPDPLAPAGQDWGFQPPHPFTQRQNGYDYFRQVLQASMRYAGILRIDHVMQLHRLFVIPQGLGSSEGLYLQYPAEELYAILNLEAHLNLCSIVGEDLGTVPDYVRESMHRHGYNRMYVVPFEIDRAARNMKPVTADSVVYLNTHDMPPFSAWVQGEDIAEEDEAAKSVRSEEVKSLSQKLWDSIRNDDGFAGWQAFEELLLKLAESPAQTLLVNLEDLWGEKKPQNIPGTTDEYPNWRRRCALPLEEIKSDDLIINLFNQLSEQRNKVENLNNNKLNPKKHHFSLLTEDDIFLFNEGTHYQLYDKLGSHTAVVNGVPGVYFAVWAPNAEKVTVIGEFNSWGHDTALDDQYRLHPHGGSGIWEGFIPSIKLGELYKYKIFSRVNGYVVEKADPYGFMHEIPPRTASLVYEDNYIWNDNEWMKNRYKRNGLDAPISIYEMHLGSWRRNVEEGGRSLTYREIAPLLVKYLQQLNYTHVEFMPLMEHPFYGSWGYQITGFFASTSRYGSPEDLKYLVDQLHQAGIGVIIDWVPSHFPSDEHGLAYFDGTHLFEHADLRQGFHPDWRSLIFNYNRHEVRSFLISSAYYWLDQFHFDGLRVDAVASMLYLDYSRKEGEWIPNEYGGRENLQAIEFLKQFNTAVYAQFPDVITIAEESTSYAMVSKPVYSGGLGFGFKWDMGWMHDTLKYFQEDSIHRKFHHGELSFRMLYAFHENFNLVLSHDEVVYGKGSLLRKMPGDDWQKFANLRLLQSYMYAQPGKKLLFMGGEFAQWNEWDHESSLDWDLAQYDRHKGMQLLVSRLNQLYQASPALYQSESTESCFEWINASDSENSVFSFLRKDNQGNSIAVVLNFTPVVRENYIIGVPEAGEWREIFNSDEEEYGGSGQIVNGKVHTDDIEYGGRYPCQLSLILPPLSVLFLEKSTV